MADLRFCAKGEKGSTSFSNSMESSHDACHFHDASGATSDSRETARSWGMQLFQTSGVLSFMKTIFLLFALIAGAFAQGPRPSDLGESALPLGDPGIAWYPELAQGLAEAKRTNKPILFMAVASQCGGISGVF